MQEADPLAGRPKQLGELAEGDEHAHAGEVAAHDGVGDELDEPPAPDGAVERPAGAAERRAVRASKREDPPGGEPRRRFRRGAGRRGPTGRRPRGRRGRRSSPPVRPTRGATMPRAAAPRIPAIAPVAAYSGPRAVKIDHAEGDGGGEGHQHGGQAAPEVAGPGGRILPHGSILAWQEGSWQHAEGSQLQTADCKLPARGSRRQGRQRCDIFASGTTHATIHPRHAISRHRCGRDENPGGPGRAPGREDEHPLAGGGGRRGQGPASPIPAEILVAPAPRPFAVSSISPGPCWGAARPG